MGRVLTEEQMLVESFTYDRETGKFFWKDSRPADHFKTASSMKRWFTLFAGKEVCNPDRDGDRLYNKLNLNGVKYKAHRVAWLFEYGEWPYGEVDHINRDGLDNRIHNLRDVDKSTNLRNMKLKKNNSSGYKDVRQRKDTGKWVARGCKTEDGVNIRIYLGQFDTYEEAVLARKAWETVEGNFPNQTLDEKRKV